MKKCNFMMGLATVAAMFVASVLFVSCEKDNNDPDGPDVTLEEELSGKITATKTLDANTVYTITGPVFVEAGGVLNIPKGTRIEAEKSFSSYILVLQGGKINVNGTKEDPVVMTSASASPAAGDWGGLVINGRAPLTYAPDNSTTSKTASTEINGEYSYGGDVPDDDSGSISFLVLEYTGAKDNADVEHNGLTLNGVGSGTTIHDIFVVNGADDGIEFFGGSVNVTNLLVVNSDDDMFDFTYGYCGKLENAYGVWESGFGSTESDPSGVEADGNFDGNSADDIHQSDFTIRNMTIDLRLAYNADKAAKKFMQNILRVRRGATAHIDNALVKGVGYAEYVINLTDSKGNAATATEISLTNSLGNPSASTLIAPTSGFAGVAIETGNTGCTATFDWTGYNF